MEYKKITRTPLCNSQFLDDQNNGKIGYTNSHSDMSFSFEQWRTFDKTYYQGTNYCKFVLPKG